MKMQEQPQSAKWFQSRRTTLVLLGLFVVGAFSLFTGHTAHVPSILPFVIFLLCPLMPNGKGLRRRRWASKGKADLAVDGKPRRLLT